MKLLATWGGLRKHKPPEEAALDWAECASPKLVRPEERPLEEDSFDPGSAAPPGKSPLYFGVRAKAWPARADTLFR